MAEVHSTSSSTAAKPATSPDPEAIPNEKWVAGEDPILQVLNCVYPTLDSEEKRKDVIEFMQKLIRSSLGVEVFPYGSTPLKTYLPDGDIDFTAIGPPGRGNILPHDVLHLLQAQEYYGNNEFEIRDVTFIDAEVKLVKCIVSGIVIDISFNMLGGLCTLCFLEQVDRHIGNDHIFKRSIILIKTWCFYESRLLGANYGLLSTYALAVLVLYIFQVFGASITSPLMALYRFLDYYSKFDWDNYCINLNGVVNKSSLPDIVVENPLNQMTGAFLNDEFLKKCMDMFLLRPKESETYVPDFVSKYLNIMDPLKETNNLGRSVQQANSYRILSALRYGARTLGQVLELDNESIEDGIQNFFATTLQRHKSKYIPDVPLPLMFDTISSSSFSESEYEDDVDSNMSYGDYDVYLSGKDDVSDVGSGEESDLDAFQDLTLEPTDEVAKGGSGHDDVADEFLFDYKISDLTDGFGETESLSPFADLTGDYESSLRSLSYGQFHHGYALTASLFMNSRPRLQPYEWAAGPVRLLSAWFHRGSPPPPPPPPPQVNPNGVVYPNGQPTVGNGQHFQMEERNTVRGTGPYIPNTNFLTGGQGRGSGPPVPTRQQEQARARSNYARRQAYYSQRKLVFGTFAPVNPVNGSSSGSQGPTPTYVACGLTSQGSVQSEKVFLKNEEDFPPLAA
ncbi:hypothetical protein LXL04_036639 [Taraxacum kok-saghyz]